MADIPRIGLGTWALDKGDVLKSVLYAFEEAGYRHIDCAEYYGNEPEIGVALNTLFSRGKVKREDIFITSKLWNTHHHVQDIEPALRNTLKNLQVDYLDLYLIHWPIAWIEREGGKLEVDRTVKIAEVWAEFEKFLEQKLVRRIGVSNFTIEMLERMRYDPNIKVQPYTNQIELNLYMQQEAMRQYLEDRGIWLTGYSTLGTGSWEKDGNPNLLTDQVLNEVATEVKQSPGSVALKFLLQISPRTVVLAKSRTPERLKGNIELNFTLSDAQVARLKGRERCFRFVNPVKSFGFNIFGDLW
jgi:aldehyde reductase